MSSDALQVAAQEYPWMYMTSTLDACFKDSEKSTKNDLEKRSATLSDEESSISDERIRFEAEKAIEFYDNLKASDKFAKDAPVIIQSFLSHGDACTELESKALALASKLPDLDGDEDVIDNQLREYNDILDRLGQLLSQAFDLEASILRLTVASSASTGEDERAPEAEVDATASIIESEHESKSQSVSIENKPSSSSLDSTSPQSQSQHLSPLNPIFTACLPIVRARVRNIEMAQELVEGAKRNLSMSVWLESMGLGEGEGDEDETEEIEEEEEEEEKCNDKQSGVDGDGDGEVGNGVKRAK